MPKDRFVQDDIDAALRYGAELTREGTGLRFKVDENLLREFLAALQDAGFDADTAPIR